MKTDGDFANYTVSADNLSTMLAGADKPYVLDIRKTEDFNNGHIDGANHIDYLAVAVPDNLKMLPKDKKIVVVCYTGNTAAQTTEILNFLGYDANVLKYGMMGWNGTGKASYINDLEAANNPVVTS